MARQDSRHWSWAFPTFAALALTGCNGAIWGNLSVLLITCGIFFGTLSLGRRSLPVEARSPVAAVDRTPAQPET